MFSWLSWSEEGFFYFSGGFLALLFVTPLPLAVSIVACFNLLALPYTVFSIYYQGRVAHQWCVLCLSVQALLLLGGINVLTNGLQTIISSMSFEVLWQCFVCYLFPVALWYTAKPSFLRLQEVKNTQRAYQRINNVGVFDALLKKRRQITVSTEGLGISRGNSEATNRLVKVCNPYCSPCSRAHFEIEELLQKVRNLQIQIIFTAPDNPDDRAYQPVSRLLAIAQQGQDGLLEKALDDWYAQRDYPAFAVQYPVAGADRQSSRIAAMHRWCEQMGISYTPTIFINGNEIPLEYEIKDLSYFLLE